MSSRSSCLISVSCASVMSCWSALAPRIAPRWMCSSWFLVRGFILGLVICWNWMFVWMRWWISSSISLVGANTLFRAFCVAGLGVFSVMVCPLWLGGGFVLFCCFVLLRCFFVWL